MIKTLVIMANSVKHHKHCVAGKTLDGSTWIRPVANEDGKELTDEQARFRNPYGRFLVKPLQKIQMNFSKHVPLSHQPENYLISDTEWIQRYKVSIDEIPRFVDNPEDLWGRGNAVDANTVTLQTIQQSLYLVQVENLRLVLDQRKRRARFSFNDINYDLPVTDPNFTALKEGACDHNSYLCVSLGEEYHGRHYKIIATVL